MKNIKQEYKDDSQLIENLVCLRRNSRTVKGGRIMSRAALVVVGDGKGNVGFAIGKGKEAPVCIQKATNRARRKMVQLHLVDKSVTYDVTHCSGSTKIFIGRAAPGTGLIAGKSVRAVLEAAGIENALSKIYGSSNPINVVRATIECLQKIHAPSYFANKRGKDIKYFFEKK